MCMETTIREELNYEQEVLNYARIPTTTPAKKRGSEAGQST